MATTPFTVEAFGGLDITSDPFEVGQRARNLRNVRLDAPGKLVTRGGFDTLNTTALTGVTGFLGTVDPDGVPRYLSWASEAGGTLRLYDYGLTHAAPSTGLSTHYDQVFAATYWGGIAIGGGALIARSNDVILLVFLTSAAQGISGSPRARFLADTGVEGRYIAAYSQIAAAPLPYRVHFSNPGTPLTWGATDYVDLWKADAEPIHAATTFRDQVFVFKRRRFAVFNGESVDSDGGAIFNYRPVDVGIGCAHDHGAVTGPDGVYFIADDGIYRTAGDAPTLISGPLQALFDASTPEGWTGPTAIATPRLFAAQDRLCFINDSKVFSYRYATGDWTYDSYTPGVQLVVQTSTHRPRSVYFLDGAGKLCEAGDTFADDDGTAIDWAYTSGRYSLANPGDVVITRESSVVGSGTVALRLDSDLYTNQAGTATLGTAPASAEGWPAHVDQEGTWLQHTLSGTGPASVSRLTHYVSSTKAASIR